MSTTEKCFCHLNGFKVKDADARAEIENIKGALGDTNANVSNNALAISVLESKESPSGEQFDDLVDATNSISSRVTALESGSGSGGGKLYLHRISFYFDDSNTQPGINPMDCAIQLISTDSTPISTHEELRALKKRLYQNIGVFFDKYYINGIYLCGPFMYDTDTGAEYEAVCIDVQSSSTKIRFYYLDGETVKNVLYDNSYILFSDEVTEI